MKLEIQVYFSQQKKAKLNLLCIVELIVFFMLLSKSHTSKNDAQKPLSSGTYNGD